ncbi:MAG: NAD(P)/FAD-dependent oxidoreductase [Cyclobacteriaceae bacterium]|nr:NAD(P)/FAD-dependent oxidoreductase [Cyclobacteriaceae bacterium]
MPKPHFSNVYDVIIIGGGVAGLTSAIHLSRHRLAVLVIEKHEYPRHKVCGEYVSNETLPYLHSLNIDPHALGATTIARFELSTRQGTLISSSLPLGGFGISRFTFDAALANEAIQQGASLIHDKVTELRYNRGSFFISTQQQKVFTAPVAIGAYGKRSALDKLMDRDFTFKRSPFLAVKTHVKGTFPDDLVALHNFDGGYCGVSKVEDGSINLCYITSFAAFKKYKNTEEFQERVVFQNPFLKAVFKDSQPVFKSPLTISQISFDKKMPVEGHVLMCGDSSGLIHPLCGNGMGMAIRSAQILSGLIVDYFTSETKSREVLEKKYMEKWEHEFSTRLGVGRLIATLFGHDLSTRLSMAILKIFPWLLPRLIRLTHGKPMAPA